MAQKKPNRRLLHRMIEAALDREEAGYPPMAAHAAAAMGVQTGGYGQEMPGAPPKRVATTHMDSLIPINDKLLVFRALTGIDSVPALTEQGHLLRSAPNVGIYTRVITNETKAQRAYKIFNFLINTCLGVQVVVAAAVTALGAASGPHSAVTAFGAINTIMAGVLTYLRGSGLPDRLKNYQNQWKNIREYIEQREREFCLVNCDLDVQEEVFIVESMYQSVKSEMETTKSTESKNQQPDDPRIRRSVLPPSHDQSYRGSTQPGRADQTLHHDPSYQRQNTEPGPVSPIATPEPALEKEKQ
ncbi:uncharacterized protein N7511_003750 [Penicillium nucicola]|uniref:uncharacterized protein n=1 Tax=Penicillium nucicola TaxID=1850975 RepID=UPI0025453931|nr:uncharacterized protein N7511_003750 [Penicillium nucicola]KAJ5766134.1 hypothetical protein N7511_003750 [Penicillium nucicola]